MKYLTRHFIFSGNFFKDYLIIWLAAALLSLAAFQPAYFGDELLPFYLAKQSASFWQTFMQINEYKPRLVFSWIWTLLAWNKIPRIESAFLNALFICFSASLVYKLSKIIGAQSRTALFAALTLLSCRFSCVFFYDYLSGLVANMAFSSFMMILILASKPITASSLSIKRSLAILGMSVVTIFIYETYVAALFGLGLVFGLKSWQIYKQHKSEWRSFLFLSVLVWSIPLILFLLSTKIFSSLPALTGTAGIPVALGAGTVETALRFISNVFLGSNYGKDWFVGSVNIETREGMLVTVAFGTLFAIAWFCYAIEIYRGRVNRTWAIIFSILILGMIAISSLPGPEHADARWMFPVAAFSGLMATTAKRQAVCQWILLVIFACNICYFSTGSYLAIYNIASSNTAGDLVRSLSTITPSGHRGIVLGGPQGQIQWILGGDELQGNKADNGDVFCGINALKKICLDPQSALSGGSFANHYDFGLVVSPLSNASSKFRLISKSTIALLESADLPGRAALVLGGGLTGWSNWTLEKSANFSDSDLLLDPGFSGFLHIKAGSLDGKVLTYCAHLTGNSKSAMRLQINWSDDRGKFLDTQIQIAQPTTELRCFSMLIDRPDHAMYADIYSRLHDGGIGQVALESVMLSGTQSP